MINLHFHPGKLQFASRVKKSALLAASTGLFAEVLVTGFDDEQMMCRLEADGASIKQQSLVLVGKVRLTRLLKVNAKSIAVGWHHRGAITNVHSISLLPAALVLSVARRHRIVYDTHEFESEKRDHRYVIRALLRLTERASSFFLSGVIVVTSSIKREYERIFPKHSIILMENRPERRLVEKVRRNSYLSDLYLIPRTSPIFVYVGLLNSGRGIEELLVIFGNDECRDRHLVFIGYGPMEQEISQASMTFSNIHAHPPVDEGELYRILASADAGFALGDPSFGLSYKYSLPNKLFQYLATGLVPLCTDLVEQRRLLDQHKTGHLVTLSSESLRDAIVTYERARQQSGISLEPPFWEDYRASAFQLYSGLLATGSD